MINLIKNSWEQLETFLMEMPILPTTGYVEHLSAPKYSKSQQIKKLWSLKQDGVDTNAFISTWTSHSKTGIDWCSFLIFTGLSLWFLTPLDYHHSHVVVRLRLCDWCRSKKWLCSPFLKCLINFGLWSFSFGLLCFAMLFILSMNNNWQDQKFVAPIAHTFWYRSW